MYPIYLSCIKNSNLPPSVSCPVNRNANDEDCLFFWYQFQRDAHLFFIKIIIIIIMIIMMMMMMVMMMIIIIIIIIIIIAFKGAIRDFLQSPHSAVNSLQHVRSNGPGATVCKSRATHLALITCKSCCVPLGTKGQLSYYV